MHRTAIHLAHADCPTTAWRNGGGVARAIASGDGWDLRSAEIARSGPFSAYPGARRHFALVQGRVSLAFAPPDGTGSRAAIVDAGAPAGFVFDGGPPCDCTLLDGDPAIALNLIIDPDRTIARMWRVDAGAPDEAGLRAAESVACTGFMCVDGAFRLDVFLFGPEGAPAGRTAPPVRIPDAARRAAALCFRIEHNRAGRISTDARR
ncbi:MAG: HutD family protein [Lautropia sp.]